MLCYQIRGGVTLSVTPFGVTLKCRTLSDGTEDLSSVPILLQFLPILVQTKRIPLNCRLWIASLTELTSIELGCKVFGTTMVNVIFCQELYTPLN